MYVRKKVRLKGVDGLAFPKGATRYRVCMRVPKEGGVMAKGCDGVFLGGIRDGYLGVSRMRNCWVFVGVGGYSNVGRRSGLGVFGSQTRFLELE